ncbi:MAG: hypothetical protein PWR20_2462 [Bacteroidales bacterium]|nr:hypothetical protein [Bacteroidales bacterium]
MNASEATVPVVNDSIYASKAGSKTGILSLREQLVQVIISVPQIKTFKYCLIFNRKTLNVIYKSIAVCPMLFLISLF